MKKEVGRGRDWRGVWDEEGIEIFRQELGEVQLSSGKVQEEWEKMEGKVKNTVKRMNREGEERRKKS